MLLHEERSSISMSDGLGSSADMSNSSADNWSIGWDADV
jgi:hypothetical protein